MVEIADELAEMLLLAVDILFCRLVMLDSSVVCFSCMVAMDAVLDAIFVVLVAMFVFAEERPFCKVLMLDSSVDCFD